MSSAARRRHAIRRLIASGSVRSQGELASRLAKAGLPTAQATLSRDLRALGVVKGPAGYQLAPGATAPRPGPGSPLAQALRDLLLEARPAASLVVLRTPPGAAGVLALELDRSPPAGVLGTVAGDDTIFVASPSAPAARRLATMLLAARRPARPKEPS